MHHILELNDEKIKIPFCEKGYVYATSICQKVNKLMSDYLRLKDTKNIIELISKEFTIPITKVIIIRKGNFSNKIHQGTWIHRELVLHFAIWCSPYFTLQVNKWMEEWFSFKKENETLFYNTLYNIKPYTSNDEYKEKTIQIRLQKELGGQIEVETENGFIDLLTDNEIIEVKLGKLWKHAVGQILMYSIDFPNYQKRIHLFDIQNDDKITNSCKIYNIVVTYE